MLLDSLTKNHYTLSIIQFLTLLFSRDLFLILLLNVIYHWIILKNECILSYYYKKNRDKKYILGSNVDAVDLNSSKISKILLFIFLYIVLSYLIYKYTSKNKILVLLFTIIYLSTYNCKINNKLHNSIFNNF